MTKTKVRLMTHTPGPWKVFGSFKSIVHQVGDKFEVLAEVKYPLFSMNVEEAKANASLIAVAPELLEMLKRLSFLIDHSDDRHFKGIHLDDLIAKAEGH